MRRVFFWIIDKYTEIMDRFRFRRKLKTLREHDPHRYPVD